MLSCSRAGLHRVEAHTLAEWYWFSARATMEKLLPAVTLCFFTTGKKVCNNEGPGAFKLCNTMMSLEVDQRVDFHQYGCMEKSSYRPR